VLRVNLLRSTMDNEFLSNSNDENDLEDKHAWRLAKRYIRD